MSTTPRPVVGTARLRRLNTGQVLESLRRAERPLRLAELSDRTELTRPTVTAIVGALVEAGVVAEEEPVGAGGRPATSYALRAAAFPVLGIDVGAHRVAARLQDLRGTELASLSRAHDRPVGAPLLQVTREVVAELLTTAGVHPGMLAATVMATVGVVNAARGRVVRIRGIQGWTEMDLPEAVRETVGGAVAVENDANMGALAMRALPGVPESFVSLQWGQRIGGGVVLDGRLVRGVRGEAGEFGGLQLTDPATGAPVDLEGLIGTGRIAADAGVDLATLFQRAGAGDAAAAERVAGVARTLASAVAPVCVALDITTVTVAGGIARAGDVLADAVVAALAAAGVDGARCVISPYAEDTVVRGAAIAADELAWAELLEELAAVL